MAEVSQNCSNVLVHVLDRKRASHTFIELRGFKTCATAALKKHASTVRLLISEVGVFKRRRICAIAQNCAEGFEGFRAPP